MVVAAFAAATVGFIGYLWMQSGGNIPGITTPDYRLTAEVPHAQNLVPHSDVMIAGIRAGTVETIEQRGDSVALKLHLDSDAAPVREGAQVQVSQKTLVGQSYVKLIDGDGEKLPSGSKLPESAALESVDLRTVLQSLDEPTLDALSKSIQTLGGATEDTQESLTALFEGLGSIGRTGHTATQALAAQSGDLEQLLAQSTELLDTFDTRQGQIARVVEDAQQLTQATAGQNEALEQSIRSLPGVLDSAKTASEKVAELSGDLAPVAEDLKKAAPGLDAALQELPAVSRDVRTLLPTLDNVLDRSPATLRKIPRFSDDVDPVVPVIQDVLRDVNPMLEYLRPYGPDVAAFFANWHAAMDYQDEDGNTYLRLKPTVDDQTVKPNPTANLAPTLRENNPYPAGGSMDDPQPFTGDFPRVERDEE
ncbi:MlaD family protein [Haloechinothrix alba]|nr:MlaD family protein [Haloechinothrix alba]